MTQPPAPDNGTNADRATTSAKIASFLRPRLLHWPVVIALVAVVGLYAAFAAQQYSRLSDLHQRELANAAAQLKRSLDNALETVSRIQPVEAPRVGALGPVRQDADETSLCAFDRNQPYLAIVPPEACSQPFSGRLTVSMSDREDEPLTLIATTSSSQRLAFKFLADVALGELSFPESFGLIFIADQDGHILYDDAPSKRVWLRHLRWGEQRFRDSAAAYEGHAALGQAKHIFGEESARGWQRLSAMSGRTTLQLAGDDHAIFFEPLTLDTGTRVNFVLGGAVSRRALIRQALAVDSYFLVVLVFLLLLTFLGLPFVKLLSLDPHERYALRDVTLLYVSTAALTALFTFSIEALNGYIRWNDEAGRGLAQLADRLAEQVQAEIRALQSEVERYDRHVSHESLGTLVNRPPVIDWYNAERSHEEPSLDLPSPDVHIENLSWIDSRGRQLWKVTADTIRSKQSDLSNRLYFRSVRDGHLFTIDETTKPFHVGPDRSVTNGKFYTFFSMPSHVGQIDAAGSHGPVVALATTRLLSLRAVPLPAGYGYAIVDRTGRALYHSDARLSLRENVFHEMSTGTRARSIVYAGQESSMTGAYRERPHAFHLRPLALKLAAGPGEARADATAGLYLVTFRDTTLDMTTVARAFLQALCGPGLLIVAVIVASMGIMALVAKRKEDHWSVWLWPKGLAHVYPTISAALGVLLVASLVGMAGGARDIVVVTLPVLSLGAAVTIYGRAARTPTTDTSHSTDWHTLMFLLLLVCTTVVPAAAVFRAAIGHEFGKRIATERDWMDAQCADLPHALKADVLAEGRPALMGDRMAAIAESRCIRWNGSDAVRPFSRTPARLSSATHWLLAPYHWADGLVPIASDDDARVRHQEPGNSDASSLAAGRFFWGTGWGLVGYPSLILALAWWLRRKAVFLFFADLPSQPRAALGGAEAWERCTPEEQLLLAHAVLDGMVNPYRRPMVEALCQRGALSVDPNLRPSAALSQFIRGEQVQLRQQLRQSERVDSSHSWRFARGVLVASGVGLAVFLFATQPALQSEFIGIASAVSGALATLLKVWDVFASRVADRKLERGSNLVAAD